MKVDIEHLYHFYTCTAYHSNADVIRGGSSESGYVWSQWFTYDPDSLPCPEHGTEFLNPNPNWSEPPRTYTRRK